MWEYRARLVRVIDGDTVVLLCDTGFNGRQEESFRLLGVYVPELNRLGGKETRLLVENWFKFLPKLRWPILVRTDVKTLPEPDERRTFVRYLATIYDIHYTEITLNTEVNQYLSEHPEWF